MSKLRPGLYDQILTEQLKRDLDEASGTLSHELSELDLSDLSQRLSVVLNRQIAELLEASPAQERDQLITNQLNLMNDLLKKLRLDPVLAPPKVLRRLSRGNLDRQTSAPPETGLLHPWLFTAGKGTPSLLGELRHELANCESVDILVSFIKVSGVRKIMDVLNTATSMDALGQTKLKIRVLTTTYMGATEQKALDLLASLPGCEVRISYDSSRTRLHAKAWIFRRDSGFGTAYVGSSNLSSAALFGGLEWTVKFTEQGQNGLYSRAKAHFETLWQDTEFEAYDAKNEKHRQTLQSSLKQEALSGTCLGSSNHFFDLKPKDFQQEILELLRLERSIHKRMKNLVVAATGTGKTMIAAFDYARTCQEHKGYPRLLFVAHRKEILVQSLDTYRQVLKNSDFGSILAEGKEPERWEHLFATIQSLSSMDAVSKKGPDYWHTVVIDECHHMRANQFDTLLKTIRPLILLGLTATPERTDGQSILTYFDNHPDGSPAVELRLWHALDRQLLCPFEYYALNDPTDFSLIKWGRTGELEQLDKLLTGNDIRAKTIIWEWVRLNSNPAKTKTLAFCVSIAHAQFMAEQFNKAGYEALCVTSRTDAEIRRAAPQRLNDPQDPLCVIVTCDLYNEGVDLPFVDTLLLLRPTQSALLFQQQIGRGLRLHPNKESCLILDFVGTHSREFRFDHLLSSITGLTRHAIEEAVKKGFHYLPPGCHIQLSHQTQTQLLNHLRRQIRNHWQSLITELKNYSLLKETRNFSLTQFLSDQHLNLNDIYRDNECSGWSLLRQNTFEPERSSEDLKKLGDKLTRLLHYDDRELIALLIRLRRDLNSDLSTKDQLRLQMLAHQLEPNLKTKNCLHKLREIFQTQPEILNELKELGEVLLGLSCIETRTLPGLEDIPLHLHARYNQSDILTAFGYHTDTERNPVQAGVLALKDRQIELLFVTLDKSTGFHEDIAYRDYALSDRKFHWQSQNSAGPDTSSGKRYIESPENGWNFYLFVRINRDSPYHACGPVKFIGYSGSRPMSIEWGLLVPLPLHLFREFRILRGG